MIRLNPFRPLLRPVLHPYTARSARHRRFLSSSTPSRSPPSIYVSDSHDPWFNLAFEDWLFRKTDPEQKILYMYRNEPSVIIGRNQNPWKEIDLARLRQLGIPFVRRKSGGGTVYHDLGNTNYCVFVPRLEFDRKTNAELVTAGLRRLDLEAYYVSGSAFKLVNKRAYHHGTMLIEAQLGNLRGVLGNKRESMVTKGVASVPSPVRNLRKWSKEVSHEKFVEVVAREFADKYGLSGEIKRVDESEARGNEYVRDVVAELKSWEWQYGQTPEFTHEITGSFDFGSLTMSISSRHGLITSASLPSPPLDLEWWQSASELCELLAGDRYESMEQTTQAVRERAGDEGERLRVLVEWLRGEM
ncbi:putative lipoate-protein ligase A [Rhodotorula toruloides]|nr:putative lipoate-protein ligase A [Rhodotorula toruloides]